MAKEPSRQRLDSHERFEHQGTTTGSSNRSFGLIIGAALGVIGLWPLVTSNRPRGWALVLGGVFVLTALARPHLLASLNTAWTRLGLAMHRVVSPVVLGLVFYTTLTPIGLLMRMLGKDVLRLKRDPELSTYWIPRVPPGPGSDTMRRQF
jgi:Saxitoxin biosynthesis operon protein SxtJ